MSSACRGEAESIKQLDAYLAFGGNLGAVKPRILAAWEMLEQTPIITVAARSQLYRTAPVGGPPDQNDYVNAACRVRTTASARELLDCCLSVEERFGRTRGVRWGPRTLDIDLLLYGGESIDEPELTVPHPRLRERLFALVPLSDVAQPGLLLPPDGERLEDALSLSLLKAHETVADWRRRVIV